MAVTSTVLDVTVMLLCVSASVVALGASNGGAPDGPTAADVADRLVTETATVGYRDGGVNETRRVHATRAELLGLLAVRDADEPFDRRAIEAVRSGLGPRTRIDVEVKRGNETESIGEDGDVRDSDLSSTVGEREVWAARASIRPWTDGGSIPVRTVDESGSAGLGAGPAGAASQTEPVVIGGDPPPTANVTAAVVRQPVPRSSDERPGDAAFVRIVVRRW